MKWSQFILSLVLVVCTQTALADDKDPVCGIFKRVVKLQNTLHHTGYVFMADGTGYLYYWDNQTKKTTGGPDIKWERIARGEYRYHRSWTEVRWDGKKITKHQSHAFSLSDDGSKLLSPDEPPYREVPGFYRVN